MGFSLDDRIVGAPGVLFKELDGEAVLLDLDSECYFGLNETAARLWALLAESPSLRSAMERIRDEYDVDPDALERDITEMVAEWLDRGLVGVARD